MRHSFHVYSFVPVESLCAFFLFFVFVVLTDVLINPLGTIKIKSRKIFPLHAKGEILSKIPQKRKGRRMGIVIHTKPLCPFSRKAKQLLSQMGKNFHEINSKHPDWPTLPYIIKDGQLPTALFNDLLLGTWRQVTSLTVTGGHRHSRRFKLPIL
eukprot:g69761.t1